jgi:cytochrome c oxidase cbb3-type subunit IV
MDLDTLRYATTVLSFFAFAGIVAWAMSARNQRAFEEAQQLPFQETGDSQ